MIAVAERGLLSIDNLANLQSKVLPNGQPLEFFLAVPGRRYGEFAELLDPINQAAKQTARPELVDEQSWKELRLIVAHDCHRAQEQSTKRDQQIAQLEHQAAQWVGKLDALDAGSIHRGRKLSDGGGAARFYRAREAHLTRTYG